MDQPEAQRLSRIMGQELQLKYSEDIDVYQLGNGEYVCRIRKPGRWYIFIWGAADFYQWKKRMA